jgi:hypothetical protein
MTDAMRRAAHLRMVFLAKDHWTLTPLEIADQQTSMADARIALNLACGVPVEMISSMGYDNTDEAYASVRAGWVRHVGQFGREQMPPPWLRDDLARAHGLWMEARPDLADGDDWLAAGTAAHLAAWPDKCPRVLRGGCGICDPVTEEDT